ncbi:MAG: CBS domain-containing protein [Candidatus Bilamarchaeaceae archaeon]
MLPPIAEIARKRKRLGLTQKELAQKSGVSQSLVAKVESGALDPSYSNAKAMLETLEALERKEGKTAEMVMKSPVFSVEEGEKIGKALSIMKGRGISQMPVIGKDGRIIGSIGEENILALVEKGYGISEMMKMGVREWMGPAFPQVGPKTSHSNVVALLKENRAVLVVERGEMLGIITKMDLV